MFLKGVVEEDFLQYKKPSMFIIFPKCSFKCDIEFGIKICQNGCLANAKSICVDEKYIVDKYIKNDITSAIVFGGLEPFDTFDDMVNLIEEIRNNTDDDIVIYTGYECSEIEDSIKIIKKFKNIIVKFGRYMPNQKSHYDDILGIYLASDNQYAKKIS